MKKTESCLILSVACFFYSIIAHEVATIIYFTQA